MFVVVSPTTASACDNMPQEDTKRKMPMSFAAVISEDCI